MLEVMRFSSGLFFTLVGALWLSCQPLATPNRVPKPRQSAPGFALRSERDVIVQLRPLRALGPVVVVFYRGHF